MSKYVHVTFIMMIVCYLTGCDHPRFNIEIGNNSGTVTKGGAHTRGGHRRHQDSPPPPVPTPAPQTAYVSVDNTAQYAAPSPVVHAIPVVPPLHVAHYPPPQVPPVYHLRRAPDLNDNRVPTRGGRRPRGANIDVQVYPFGE